MLDIGFALWLLARMLMPEPEPRKAPGPVDFDGNVRPILATRCQPCHFPGGSMHAKLPFDRPETIHKLGTRLFTRIKNEDEQAVIRTFLAQR